jgi:hypothetical protein
MNSRTRRFLIGSALVMVVGLCTGLVAYYNGGLGRDLPSSEMAYLPADLGVVGYADVHAVMNSEFRQRLKQMLPTGEELERLKTEIGVDIERDIDTVVAGFSSAGPDHAGAIALLRGRFNEGDIETMATRHGAVAETYRGKRLLLTQGKGEHGGVAFLEPGLIALGEATTLKKAIDAQATNQGIAQNADLMKRVNEIQIGHKAWIVGRVDSVPHPEMPVQIRDQVAAVQWFSAGANLNGALTGTLRAIARDEASAQNLREMATGGLAAAKLFAGQDPKLQSLANSVQISGMGNSVAVNFTISPELLDMLGGMAGAHQQQIRGGIRK